MSNLSSVQIDIGGKRIDLFSRVRISQWIDRHHTFELYVPIEQVEGAGAMKINQSKEFISKEILITIKYRQGGGSPFVFRGFITQLYLSKQRTTGSSVVVRGFSASILLEQGTRYAAFYQKDHAAIVDKVLKEYDQNLLKPSVSPRNNQPEDYVVKFDESSYNFLHRFAAATGNWFYFDGDRTVFGDVPGGSPIELKFGNDISAFDMRMDLPGGEFFIEDYDYTKMQTVKSHSKDVTVTGLGEYGQFLIDKAESLYPERTFSYPPVPIWSDNAAKQQAGYEKKASVANAVIFSGSSSKIGLKVGSVIDIKESTSLNARSQRTESLGQYRIISISHEASLSGGYTNHFEAIPAGVEFRANPSFSLPRASTQLARVTHVDDPEHLGRIRVLFLWQSAQGDTESSTWVRLISPYNGIEDQGFYFIPEINETVMVMFENDDPARPLIAGVVPNKQNKMNRYYSTENYYKAIITNGGNHIVISDEPGKECISLHDKDWKNHIMMSLDGSAHIAIKSQGAINLSAGSISMDADTISMKARKEWKVDAQKGEIKTKETMDVDATTDLTLHGKTSVKASSEATVDVNGAQIKVDGRTQTTVKGQKLDLEGAAQASLKAMTVMIN
ncbi:type VI secretion system Vgr family protein [Spirosoma oryzicola]|uniref:type VI secretion system Vgr family protein n=1 Tax=Spirosoma oryzicola TaxID=2898794 RepID=UPI001E46B8A8|nr:phage baseplate assembly protein V [Spirosoma oryzicola]UHG92602.1 phage baseplate assembly protein V [Spirosoma oryzicola]